MTRRCMSLVFLLSILSLGPAAAGAPRIVGGQDDDDGEWPWQVALFTVACASSKPVQQAPRRRDRSSAPTRSLNRDV